jgi:hypothetical protein
MCLVVILVKGPNRDEFYIDVPALTEQKKTLITLKANELVNVFDKLNIYFHWVYMPLSRNEFRVGISTNIRHDSTPVNLTSENLDKILNRLVHTNRLAEIDGLYAPVEWITKSGHDMMYLATFKKLRIFMVSNAYLFTDLDASNLADMVATIHNNRTYVVIYSKTSRFIKVPIYPDSKTNIVFINEERLNDFKDKLYAMHDKESIELKMHIEAGYIRLLDADNPGEILR